MEQLCSIADAQKRLGGISRTTFYTKILPQLDAIGKEMGYSAATSKVGARRMVCVEVLRRFMVGLARFEPLWITLLVKMHLAHTHFMGIWEHKWF